MQTQIPAGVRSVITYQSRTALKMLKTPLLEYDDLCQEGAMLFYFLLDSGVHDSGRANFKTFFEICFKHRLATIVCSEMFRERHLNRGAVLSESVGDADDGESYYCVPDKPMMPEIQNLAFLAPISNAAEIYLAAILRGDYDESPRSSLPFMYQVGKQLGLEQWQVRRIRREIRDKVILFPG